MQLLGVDLLVTQTYVSEFVDFGFSVQIMDTSVQNSVRRLKFVGELAVSSRVSSINCSV